MPVLINMMNKLPSTATLLPCIDGSILKEGYVDDPGPGHLLPAVPLDYCDPNYVKSMLKYDHET